MSDEMDDDEFKIVLKKKKKKEQATGTDKDYLSTGSTLTNIACTGNPNWGFRLGHYYFFVGDSGSGKTFFCLTCMAIAAQEERFNDYEFIFDAPEDGALMDFVKFFGKKAAARIKPPRQNKSGDPVYSKTTEDLYDNLYSVLNEGKKCIYVLDSMDAITTMAELKKADKARVGRQKRNAGLQGEDVAGSYGTGKAKINSEQLPGVIGLLKKTGSILIIISQTRDNIARFSFEKKTRSGGHALRFYATLELWTAVRGKIKKRINGKMRTQGMVTSLTIKKNRQTGKDRTVEVPFYHSFGFDDIGGNINYLLKEGYWKKHRGLIHPKGIDDENTYTMDDLITHIEGNNLEESLKKIVLNCWNGIESKLEVKRKKRFQ